MPVRVIARDEVLPPGGVDLPAGDDAVAAAVLAVVSGAPAVRAADTVRVRRAVHIAERLAAARTR
jgi:hypothetical protein